MKILKLTPQEFVDMAINQSTKYTLLEQHLVNTHEGAYAYEYTYDYIFENKETKNQYIIQVEVGDDTQEDWAECFLDYLDEGDFFICYKGMWINHPRFIIEGEAEFNKLVDKKVIEIINSIDSKNIIKNMLDNVEPDLQKKFIDEVKNLLHQKGKHLAFINEKGSLDYKSKEDEELCSKLSLASYSIYEIHKSIIYK